MAIQALNGRWYSGRMRYIGIDYGSKKVGVALSDEAGRMGFPHSVLTNDAQLAEQLTTLIAHENVQAIVIGESRDFSGEENTIAREARAFAEDLEARTHLPVYWELEMLTTQEARRDFEGIRSNYGTVDSSAAALILTSFLSRLQESHQATE